MKKEIMGKILLCILCGLGIAVMDVVGIQYLSAEKLNLIEIPVASHDIDPRTEISEKDFIMTKVSGLYLMNNTFQSVDEILGKYTDIQGKIPAGSPFYKTMLSSAEALPDHASLQLKEGEAVYGTSSDSTSLSGLTAGLRVDIHLTIIENSSVITGTLLEHARILSLKDHQGISITSKESSGIPYMIEIAVRKEDLDLLSLAEAAGELRFFASSDSYQDDEAVLVSESNVVQYLQQKMTTMEIEKISENS